MTFAWVALIMGLALALTISSFFIRNPIIMMMCISAWAGVLFTNDIVWIQITAALGILWAIIAMIIRIMNWGYD